MLIVKLCSALLMASTGSESVAKTTVIKLATLAPDGSSWIEIFNDLNVELKEKTNPFYSMNPWLVLLGIMEKVSYESCEITLSSGDSCLLYSDGVIEAENESLEMFGNKNLNECIKHHRGPPWGQKVVEAVNFWRGEAEINDDLTVLEIWHDKS